MVEGKYLITPTYQPHHFWRPCKWTLVKSIGIFISMTTHLWLVRLPWQHCCSHCSWWPQCWQCVSHCRVWWLEHLFHWWWLDWGLDWQWWCSWLEPHHHTVGAATALWESHCPDHTVEQHKRESQEERGLLQGKKFSTCTIYIIQ